MLPAILYHFREDKMKIIIYSIFLKHVKSLQELLVSVYVFLLAAGGVVDQTVEGCCKGHKLSSD